MFVKKDCLEITGQDTYNQICHRSKWIKVLSHWHMVSAETY